MDFKVSFDTVSRRDDLEARVEEIAPACHFSIYRTVDGQGSVASYLEEQGVEYESATDDCRHDLHMALYRTERIQHPSLDTVLYSGVVIFEWAGWEHDHHSPPYESPTIRDALRGMQQIADKLGGSLGDHCHLEGFSLQEARNCDGVSYPVIVLVTGS